MLCIIPRHIGKNTYRSPMRLASYIFILAALLHPAGMLASEVTHSKGAYWSFQMGKRPPLTNRYSEKVSVENFTGEPKFQRQGIIMESQNSVKGLFEMYTGESWPSGRAAAWRFDHLASPGSSFQISFNGKAATGYYVRMTCNAEKLSSGGKKIDAFNAFEYKIGDGVFQRVPKVSLKFPTGGDYEWSADLSGLTEIEVNREVTLRWSLPETDAAAGALFLLDNLQISGN